MSDSSGKSRGPLAGVRIIEMAAIGPVPFCGMALADMGAEVIRVDRVAAADLGIEVDARFDCMGRSKLSVAVDLKHAEGPKLVKRLIADADALIEGFRPGVMERLGLSPETCLSVNPRLIFARCSGWGDKGPMAPRASHDINYLALSGCLAALGLKGPPPPPLNLIGDFGGAAMHLVCGVLAGLLVARTTGHGQVVSTSIADGTLGLMPMIYGLYASGEWSLNRGENRLDGGAPYYRTYETSDGRYMAVGAIEKRFYRELLLKAGLQGQVDAEGQNDRATWPQTTELLATRFKQRTRKDWTELFAGSDACVTPVIDMAEAPQHPQHVASGAFVEVGGVKQPVSGARFSVSTPALPTPAPLIGAHTAEFLTRLGYGREELTRLQKNGVISMA